MSNSQTDDDDDDNFERKDVTNRKIIIISRARIISLRGRHWDLRKKIVNNN